jgi:16S rRNA (guanine966-N2)-methyltransferase
MLRITAGRFRGRPIQTVKDNAVRPTTGRVRESVFQILGARVEDALFLDIFSGSGLMGFEALSRALSRIRHIGL